MHERFCVFFRSAMNGSFYVLDEVMRCMDLFWTVCIDMIDPEWPGTLAELRYMCSAGEKSEFIDCFIDESVD